jgi:hypothetical protein
MKGVPAIPACSPGPPEGLVSQYGGPVHHPPGRQIVGVGIVLGDPVVPDGDIILLPI